MLWLVSRGPHDLAWPRVHNTLIGLSGHTLTKRSRYALPWQYVALRLGQELNESGCQNHVHSNHLIPIAVSRHFMSIIMALRHSYFDH
jgi:hypothetical protein